MPRVSITLDRQTDALLCDRALRLGLTTNAAGAELLRAALGAPPVEPKLTSRHKDQLEILKAHDGQLKSVIDTLTRLLPRLRDPQGDARIDPEMCALVKKHREQAEIALKELADLRHRIAAAAKRTIDAPALLQQPELDIMQQFLSSAEVCLRHWVFKMYGTAQQDTAVNFVVDRKELEGLRDALKRALAGANPE